MKQIQQDATAETASRPNLEIELLVNPEKRVSVAGHHHFRESLRASTDGIDDDIDAFVEDLRHAEFEGKGSRP
jgi:hypothetical protein